jgi:hypothetical protein
MAGLTIQNTAEGGTHHVTIVGSVDEDSDLSVLNHLRGRVELNLRGLRRFNSVGIRFWMDAMRALTERAHVVAIECSRSVIDQMNMIRGFLGGATVRSFYGPMRCERCDVDHDHLFDRKECAELGGLPPVPCPRCGVAMDLDDLEDSFVLFIREPTVVR